MAKQQKQPVVLIAGLGLGLGVALCKQLQEAGYQIAGLTRSPEKIFELLNTNDSDNHSILLETCDLTNASSVCHAIDKIEDKIGAPSVLIYNAAQLVMKKFSKTTPEDFETTWKTFCLGAVNVTQRLLSQMQKNKSGVLLFTGATASIKAGASFSAFSSAKFALRGLAQSLARELGPNGIHVAHIIIDGMIWCPQTSSRFSPEKNNCLLPEDIVETYLHLIQQKRSVWTHELDIRPDVENF